MNIRIYRHLSLALLLISFLVWFPYDCYAQSGGMTGVLEGLFDDKGGNSGQGDTGEPSDPTSTPPDRRGRDPLQGEPRKKQEVDLRVVGSEGEPLEKITGDIPFRIEIKYNEKPENPPTSSVLSWTSVNPEFPSGTKNIPVSPIEAKPETYQSALYFLGSLSSRDSREVRGFRGNSQASPGIAAELFAGKWTINHSGGEIGSGQGVAVVSDDGKNVSLSIGKDEYESFEIMATRDSVNGRHTLDVRFKRKDKDGSAESPSANLPSPIVPRDASGRTLMMQPIKGSDKLIPNLPDSPLVANDVPDKKPELNYQVIFIADGTKAVIAKAEGKTMEVAVELPEAPADRFRVSLMVGESINEMSGSWSKELTNANLASAGQQRWIRGKLIAENKAPEDPKTTSENPEATEDSPEVTEENPTLEEKLDDAEKLAVLEKAEADYGSRFDEINESIDNRKNRSEKYKERLEALDEEEAAQPPTQEEIAKAREDPRKFDLAEQEEREYEELKKKRAVATAKMKEIDNKIKDAVKRGDKQEVNRLNQEYDELNEETFSLFEPTEKELEEQHKIEQAEFERMSREGALGKKPGSVEEAESDLTNLIDKRNEIVKNRNKRADVYSERIKDLDDEIAEQKAIIEQGDSILDAVTDADMIKFNGQGEKINALGKKTNARNKLEKLETKRNELKWLHEQHAKNSSEEIKGYDNELKQRADDIERLRWKTDPDARDAEVSRRLVEMGGKRNELAQIRQARDVSKKTFEEESELVAFTLVLAEKIGDTTNVDHNEKKMAQLVRNHRDNDDLYQRRETKAIRALDSMEIQNRKDGLGSSSTFKKSGDAMYMVLLNDTIDQNREKTNLAQKELINSDAEYGADSDESKALREEIRVRQNRGQVLEQQQSERANGYSLSKDHVERIKQSARDIAYSEYTPERSTGSFYVETLLDEIKHTANPVVALKKGAYFNKGMFEGAVDIGKGIYEIGQFTTKLGQEAAATVVGAHGAVGTKAYDSIYGTGSAIYDTIDEHGLKGTSLLIGETAEGEWKRMQRSNDYDKMSAEFGGKVAINVATFYDPSGVGVIEELRALGAAAAQGGRAAAQGGRAATKAGGFALIEGGSAAGKAKIGRLIESGKAGVGDFVLVEEAGKAKIGRLIEGGKKPPAGMTQAERDVYYAEKQAHHDARQAANNRNTKGHDGRDDVLPDEEGWLLPQSDEELKAVIKQVREEARNSKSTMPGIDELPDGHPLKPDKLTNPEFWKKHHNEQMETVIVNDAESAVRTGKGETQVLNEAHPAAYDSSMGTVIVNDAESAARTGKGGTQVLKPEDTFIANEGGGGSKPKPTIDYKGGQKNTPKTSVWDEPTTILRPDIDVTDPVLDAPIEVLPKKAKPTIGHPKTKTSVNGSKQTPDSRDSLKALVERFNKKKQELSAGKGKKKRLSAMEMMRRESTPAGRRKIDEAEKLIDNAIKNDPRLKDVNKDDLLRKVALHAGRKDKTAADLVNDAINYHVPRNTKTGNVAPLSRKKPPPKPDKPMRTLPDEPRLLDNKGKPISEAKLRQEQRAGEVLLAKLKKYYGNHKMDSMHVTSTENLAKIRKSGKMVTEGVTFSNEGVGRLGGEALRIRPGSNKYVHMGDGGAYGVAPKYYKDGIKYSPDGKTVDLTKGNTYIPLKHLQYFDKKIGRWMNFK